MFTLGLYNQPPRGVVFYEGIYSLKWIEAASMIGGPASFISGCALIAWAIRLVIMYDPAKRKRWGRHVKEDAMFRALVWLYAAIQGVVWLVMPFYGLQR